MIKHVVTRGFGNGTFAGEIARVVTRGYGIGDAVAIVAGPYYYAALGTHDPGAVSSGTHDPGMVAGEVI